ncbi:MAG: ABC-type Mn2+/Zn2+ transport system permease subunit [Candidatus Paceibacteria bacterium]|jgi:ABC-type Mn2+/Zn2+ transport system permease subunit
MLELLQLEFMQRAFIAGIVLAPLLAVLGSFVTLRKMSFFADGIAHASLLGVAISILAGIAPFGGALIIGVFFGILIFLLERYTTVASDAVIGIIFTTGLALGIVLISLAPGYQPDLISFLFGNILAITWSNVWMIVTLSIVILATIFLMFKKLTLTSLSPELAWASGVSTNYINLIFYILLSVAVVLGVKLLGIILVSALVITPSVTAKLVTGSFSSYVTWSVVFSLLAFIGGLFASYYLDLPSGASIVLTATSIFIVTLFSSKFLKAS